MKEIIKNSDCTLKQIQIGRTDYLQRVRELICLHVVNTDYDRKKASKLIGRHPGTIERLAGNARKKVESNNVSYTSLAKQMDIVTSTLVEVELTCKCGHTFKRKITPPKIHSLKVNCPLSDCEKYVTIEAGSISFKNTQFEQ